MEEPIVTIYEYAIINGEFRKHVYNTTPERKKMIVKYFLRKKNNTLWITSSMLDKVDKNHIYTLRENDAKNFTLLLSEYERRVEEYRTQLRKSETVLAALQKEFPHVTSNSTPVTHKGLVEQIMEFEPNSLQIMGWLDAHGYRDTYSYDAGRKLVFSWEKSGLTELSNKQLEELYSDIQTLFGTLTNEPVEDEV